MKNTIQALAVIAIMFASIGNASAQYSRWGANGYTQQPSQTTNHYVPGRGLIGYSITN